MNTNIAEEIKKLKELLDQGVLTQQEFEEAKRKILSQGNQPVPSQLPPQFVPQPQPSAQQAPSAKKNNGCLTAFVVTVIVFLFLMGTISAIRSCSNRDNSSSGVSSSVSSEAGQTPEERKAAADKFDETIWAQAVELMKAHNSICQALTNYGNGTTAAVDVYNYCKDVNDSLVSWKVTEGTTDNEKSYSRNVETFALYVQQEAKAVMDYMNDPKTSNLSKVEESIQTTTSGVSKIAETRGTFLGLEGFSDEEIAEKAAKLEEELQ